MPGSALAVVNSAFPTSSMYTAANTGTDNTSQLRPHTSGCSAGARSPSPLFARWIRWQRKEADSLEEAELRTSTDERSIRSSSEPSKLLPQIQHEHRNKDEHGGHGSHTYTHSYNFSTSTRSSENQSKRPLPPPLTREEFDALPVAIQRKVCTGHLRHLRHLLAVSVEFPSFRPNLHKSSSRIHWLDALWTRSCSLHAVQMNLMHSYVQ